ncbi:MAG: beta-ketoacyl-[acyl-carrier-protein] synthase family protein [Stackebrandtia sp.]
MEKVLVTGIGVISCLGSGTEAFWSGLHARDSAPRPVPDPDARFANRRLYLVPADEVPETPAPLGGLPVGTASALAAHSARLALEDAKLGTVDPARMAVLIGTAMGDSWLRERQRAGQLEAEGDWYTEYAVAGVVAELTGARGAVSTNANACAASGYAIGVAADMIACGEADVVLVGGSETYSRVAIGNFNRLGALDPVRCRPFDGTRRGTVLGEGAGMLVLESRSHAQRRGARGYAEIAATGWSCDAHHMTAPEPGGEQIALAMRRALSGANVSSQDVSCVVPHGTGTELNDRVEYEALAAVFGPRAETVPLHNLKATIGHTAGAAGALAVCAAALIADRGVVPPNRPLERADPSCPVRLPQSPEEFTGTYLLANAYAFGGNNVSVLVKAVDR